jgi:hypothetical protein
MPEVFYLYLFGHVIGDFYFQTQEMAKRKQADIKMVCRHALLYWLAILIVSIPLFIADHAAGIIAFAAGGLAHFFIDLIKHAAARKRPDSFVIFITDQALHIAVIIAGSYALQRLISPHGITDLFLGLNVSYLTTARLITALALVGRPANVAFKKLLKAAKADDRLADAAARMKNAGSVIGTLERIIICVMFFLGEYAAIAIVLTAKSIARYNKLKTEPKFAEYYLIGTLSSIVYAILVSMVFFQPA